MATAVQKNGMKSLPNGNGLVVHQVDELTSIAGYQNACIKEDPIDNKGPFMIKQEFDIKDESIKLKDEPFDIKNKPFDIKDEQFDIKKEEIDKKEESIDIKKQVELKDEPFDIKEEYVKQEHQHVKEEQVEENNEHEPEIDIVINNVVCSFSVRCHLNLQDIARKALNVEYRKENGMVTMKLRRPYTTASIWSSGKVTCTGATSELMAKIAARRFARCLQKLGFNARFNNYRVVNVLGTCSMPFAIRINAFSERHKEADYEPELHPGVTYKLKNPKATLKIFSTGSVTVTAPSVNDVQLAIECIFPLVYEFRKNRLPEDDPPALKKRRLNNGQKKVVCTSVQREDTRGMDKVQELDEEEEEEEDPASDTSWD